MQSNRPFWHTLCIWSSHQAGILQINMSKINELLLERSANDSRVEFLAKYNLNSLKILYLPSNSITCIGARALSSGNLTSLTTLNLCYNEIGDEGAKGISSGNLTRLATLNLERIAYKMKKQEPYLQAILQALLL